MAVNLADRTGDWSGEEFERALRAAIGNIRTADRHVAGLWEKVRTAAADVIGQLCPGPPDGRGRRVE